jgi:hypothetical protein
VPCGCSFERGYDVTVEQIAPAQPQGTFLRFLPAKENTVRYDRLDPIPPGGLRAAARATVWAAMVRDAMGDARLAAAEAVRIGTSVAAALLLAARAAYEARAAD